MRSGRRFSGPGKISGQSRCLFPPDVSRRRSVVDTTRPLGAIDARAPLHHVQVELQDALLAQHQLRPPVPAWLPRPCARWTGSFRRTGFSPVAVSAWRLREFVRLPCLHRQRFASRASRTRGAGRSAHPPLRSPRAADWARSGSAGRIHTVSDTACHSSMTVTGARICTAVVGGSIQRAATSSSAAANQRTSAAGDKPSRNRPRGIFSNAGSWRA